MKKEFFRYLKLIIGLFVCSLGIIAVIKANLGFSPWDVFHQGISNITPLTIGQASIAVGVVVLSVDLSLGEPIGSGTVLNTILIGSFMDLILYLDFIPLMTNFAGGLILMLLGIFTFSVGSYLYISSGLGCGPRDSLMVALTKKTRFSVGLVRNTIEIAALMLGYLMGGHAGLGTVLVAILGGFFIEATFTLFNFDVRTIEHRNIKKEILSIKNYLKPKEG